jgi:hypothetical protein
MLLLLLLAMGWAVSRQEVACKTALFTLWSLYTLVHLMLYVWKKVQSICFRSVLSDKIDKMI